MEPSVNANRLQEINEFSEWLTLQRTDSFIIQCIINTLRRGPAGSFECEIRLLTSANEYIGAAREQDAIGWTNFLFGRVSLKWKTLQKLHYVGHHTTSRLSHMAWSKIFVGKIYRMLHSLWKFRCAQVHGVENHLASKREKKALRREIRQQYDLGPRGIRRADSYLFDRSKYEILRSSIKEQKYLLCTIKISRACFERLETNKYMKV